MPKIVVDKENNVTYLFTAYHEWAWSLRTSGFPIYAIRRNGEIVKIGTTVKRPMYYLLPDDTIVIVRAYSSYKGYKRYYIYTVPELSEFVIDEKENYTIPEFSEEVRQAVLKFLNFAGVRVDVDID